MGIGPESCTSCITLTHTRVCSPEPGLACCRFYFAYCEAAFDARYIHNFQITWVKSAEAAPAPLLGPPPSASAVRASGGKAAAHASAPTDSVTQARGHACSAFLVQTGWLSDVKTTRWLHKSPQGLLCATLHTLQGAGHHPFPGRQGAHQGFGDP